MRVPAWISCMVSSCLRPWKPHTNISSDDEDDPSTSTTSTLVQWRRDLLRHSHGEFSYAVVQGNVEIEDHSQVEIGSKGIFVGVYDGHGGATCSHFLKTRLFPIVISESCSVLGILLGAVCCYLLFYTFFLLFEVLLAGFCCCMEFNLPSDAFFLYFLFSMLIFVLFFDWCEKIGGEKWNESTNLNFKELCYTFLCIFIIMCMGYGNSNLCTLR